MSVVGRHASAHRLIAGDWHSELARYACSCGRWFGAVPQRLQRFRRLFDAEHARHVAQAEREAAHLHAATQRAWFFRTGHCGACGQPGNYCLCTDRCGCYQLHRRGSGVGLDPVSVFTTISPIEQEGLFA